MAELVTVNHSVAGSNPASGVSLLNIMSRNLTKVFHPTLGNVVFHRISGHVSDDNQDILESELLKETFPWSYAPYTVEPDSNEGIEEFLKFDDIPLISHQLVTSGRVVSDYFGPIIGTCGLEKLIQDHELTGDVIRAQINLFLKRDKEVCPCPHIDVNKTPHFGVLYYINDADGDTIFYNKSEYDVDLEGLTEWRRESPKRGDVLIFDGRIYHSPTCPTKSSHRLSLNFDILK